MNADSFPYNCSSSFTTWIFLSLQLLLTTLCSYWVFHRKLHVITMNFSRFDLNSCFQRSVPQGFSFCYLNHFSLSDVRKNRILTLCFSTISSLFGSSHTTLSGFELFIFWQCLMIYGIKGVCNSTVNILFLTLAACFGLYWNHFVCFCLCPCTCLSNNIFIIWFFSQVYWLVIILTSLASHWCGVSTKFRKHFSDLFKSTYL